MDSSNQPDPKSAREPNCRNCRHYFVTWEPRNPHGCKALGFKSSYLPHVHVFRTSGTPCQLFSLKKSRS
ncbi:MAG: uracil-DNA glycosylase [Deltaproteobacteria bacterium]|nr:uracil-DNA glycosylase [Deltaproteobacteria bacterium]